MLYFCSLKCYIFAECTNMKLKNLQSRIRYRIKRSRDGVFTLKDFLDLSDRTQVSRALRQMIAKEELIKIGYGLYAKAKKSMFSGMITPIMTLPELGEEALKKLGIQTFPTKAEKRYNAGLSTQVPTGRRIAIQGRVSRKIGFDGVYLTYENATR